MFFFILEKISFFLSNVIFILLCIALFTLIERKVMSSVQRRKGPSLTGLLGFLQPFADGLKLLINEIIVPSNFNILSYMPANMNRNKNMNKNSIHFIKRFYNQNSVIHYWFNKENYVKKNIKYIVSGRTFNIRSGFLSEVKYESNCFDVFHSSFSIREQQLIREGLLNYVCSEYYENAPNTVLITMETNNHYLFYVDGFINKQIFQNFIGNMIVFEFEKKEIFFKKKKFFYYYVLYLKYDDIRLDSIKESSPDIQKRICAFSVSWYFPPYETVKEYFSTKSDYNKLIINIDKDGYDFSNIPNLDEKFQDFVDVYNREWYTTLCTMERLESLSNINKNKNEN